MHNWPYASFKWWFVACWLLVGCQPALPDALQRTISRLRHSDPHVRHKATQSLGQYRQYAWQIHPWLLLRLQDPSPYVRASAVVSLCQLGVLPRRSVWKMALTTRYLSSLEQSRIFKQFHKHPKSLRKAIKKGLHAKQPQVQAISLWLLRQMITQRQPHTLGSKGSRPNLKTTRPLATRWRSVMLDAAPLLYNRFPPIRKEAVLTIRAFLSHTKLPAPVWKRLNRVIQRDRSPVVRQAAIGLFSRAPKNAIPTKVILSLANARNLSLRVVALKQMQYAPGRYAAFAPALKRALRSLHWQEQTAAINALSQLGQLTPALWLKEWKQNASQPNSPTRRSLLRNLRHKRPTTQQQAIVYECLQDKNVWVRRAAFAAAQGHIKQATSIPAALFQQLSSPKPEIQRQALWLLGSLPAALLRAMPLPKQWKALTTPLVQTNKARFLKRWKAARNPPASRPTSRPTSRPVARTKAAPASRPTSRPIKPAPTRQK